MGQRRGWGFATQLYSVRSQQSWGVGDLTDLEDLAVWSAAEHAADFVLVNPLHAAEPVPPMEPSPYLPTSRRFANPLYLRPERIPEYAVADAERREMIEVIKAKLLAAIADSAQIDRDRSWQAKRDALEIIFSVPRTPGREASFAAYRRREGPWLAEVRDLGCAVGGAMARTSPIGRPNCKILSPLRLPPSQWRSRPRSTSTAGCSG